MRRVLIVGFFTEWLTHLGTELEIAQRHLDDGSEVHFLICDGSIGGCRDNPYGQSDHCQRCLYRRNRSLQLLKGKVREHRLSNFRTATDEDLFNSCKSVTDATSAKNWSFQSEKLGWGALSSAIDILRDPQGIDERFAEILPRLARGAAASYLAATRCIEEHGPFSHIYIFNGRFECTLGASRAAINAGLRPSLHERGANIQKYAVFEDDTIHSRSAQHSRVVNAWNNAPSRAEAISIGTQFFQDRRAGNDKSWWSFTYRQKNNALPDGWDPSKKNIAIFNSSEDEIAAIGDEWKSHLYPRQSIGIERIVADLRDTAPEARIYLRMHPNLAGVDNSDLRRLKSICSPNLVIIEPEHQISTYALLDSANTVLTFGSTVGIEAAFWNKPSILAGPAFYETLGSVYLPRTHEELIQMICDDLPALDPLGAVQYGYYWQSFGQDFRYWKASSFIDGTFRGKSLHFYGTRFSRLLNKLASVASSQSFITRLACRLVDIPSSGRSVFLRGKPKKINVR